MKKTVALIGCVLPAAAMAMADSTPPVYGRPTLYGEYEFSTGDARRAAALYGATPEKAAVKMPIKNKKALPKKSVKKKKAAKKAPVKKSNEAPRILKKEPPVTVAPLHEQVTPVAAPVVMPEVDEKKVHAPSAEALVIATVAASDDAPSLESFCTQRGVMRKGPRPDGIILMPGRPDLMSCSDK